MSKAVERALDILIFIGKTEQHPTMSNVCKELGIPKASASDLIHTLMSHGFIRIVDDERKTLALGEQILQLGSAYRHQTDYLEIIHREMKGFTSEHNRTIFFWICQQGKMMLMDRVLSRTGIYPNVAIGALETMDSLPGLVYTKREGSQDLMVDQRIRCFAVPLFDVDGRMVGVLSTYDLSSLTEDMTGAKTMEALRVFAQRVSGKIHVGF